MSKSNRTLGIVAVILVILALAAVPIIMMLPRGQQTPRATGPGITVEPLMTQTSDGPASGSVGPEPQVTSPPEGDVDVRQPVTTPQPAAPPGPVSPTEPPPPPPPASAPTLVEVTITSPTEGSKVDHLERIDGTASDPTLTVFAVVTTFEDSATWVQRKASPSERPSKDGSGRTIAKWFCIAHFGRSPKLDRGKKFVITAIATHDPGAYPPGERDEPVPADVAQSDPVTVVRK